MDLLYSTNSMESIANFLPCSQADFFSKKSLEMLVESPAIFV